MRGAPLGLNFSGYLFNAPVKLDYRTYVTKLDWLIDNAGKHSVSFRGTLSNNGETKTAAQFPAVNRAYPMFCGGWCAFTGDYMHLVARVQYVLTPSGWKLTTASAVDKTKLPAPVPPNPRR